MKCTFDLTVSTFKDTTKKVSQYMRAYSVWGFELISCICDWDILEEYLISALNLHMEMA